jgi:hypothetical protein
MLAVWQEADDIEVYESGWTFDHFYPIFTDSNGPCLEGWTTLDMPRVFGYTPPTDRHRRQPERERVGDAHRRRPRKETRLSRAADGQTLERPLHIPLDQQNPGGLMEAIQILGPGWTPLGSRTSRPTGAPTAAELRADAQRALDRIDRILATRANSATCAGCGFGIRAEDIGRPCAACGYQPHNGYPVLHDSEARNAKFFAGWQCDAEGGAQSTRPHGWVDIDGVSCPIEHLTTGRIIGVR